MMEREKEHPPPPPIHLRVSRTISQPFQKFLLIPAFLFCAGFPPPSARHSNSEDFCTSSICKYFHYYSQWMSFILISCCNTCPLAWERCAKPYSRVPDLYYRLCRANQRNLFTKVLSTPSLLQCYRASLTWQMAWMGVEGEQGRD